MTGGGLGFSREDPKNAGPASGRQQDKKGFARAQDKNGVVVPPALARPLLRVLVRALAREAREDGGMIPPGIASFLSALAAAADDPAEPAGFATETPVTSAATVVVTVPEMARAIGATEQYVRGLCRSGVLLARRSGRPWLITVDREWWFADGHDRDADPD